MHDISDHHHHHPHPQQPPTAGHNHARRPSQWQTPHLPEGEAPTISDRERDLDLVEASFFEGFQAAKDPTSFLRLANIPFVGVTAEGRRLHLLRVQTATSADVGSVAPMLGGGAALYDPLPAQLVSHRKTLSFIYHDGASQIPLSFVEARRLVDDSAASIISFDMDSNAER